MAKTFPFSENIRSEEAHRLIDEAIEKHLASILALNSTLSFNENITSEEARRLIDGAIEEHLASILALKSQRNSFAITSCFPPEILGKIFLFTKKRLQVVALEYPLDAVEVSKEVEMSDWIPLTHVCRYWRDTALSSPYLWVDPPIGKHRWVEEMVKRSKHASLVIDADFNAEFLDIIPSLKVAFKHFSRIKYLSILGLLSGNWNDLQERLPMVAPQLESLCLEGHSITYQLEIGFGMPNILDLYITISDDVLCKTERLRHLELTNCVLNWKSQTHLFLSLTHLKLHNLWEGCRPTGQQFVDVLKGMPYLDFLDLQNALPLEMPAEASWDLGSHIHFASLRTLFITSKYGEVEPFFRCITFPPNAVVSVICYDPGPNAAFSNGAIVKGLARSYSNALAFQTLILVEYCLFGPGVNIRLFTDVLEDGELFLHAKLIAPLELSFVCTSEWDVEADTITKCMNEIFKDETSLTQAVKHVHFEKKTRGLNAETIASTIGKMPAVDYVMVTYDAAKPFFEALQINSSPYAGNMAGSCDNSVQTLSFSELTAIYLRDVVFEQPNSHERLQEDFSDSDESPTFPIKLLQDCLVQRHESDAVPDINHLTLGFCHQITEENINFLKEMVDDFYAFSSDPKDNIL